MTTATLVQPAREWAVPGMNSEYPRKTISLRRRPEGVGVLGAIAMLADHCTGAMESLREVLTPATLQLGSCGGAHAEGYGAPCTRLPGIRRAVSPPPPRWPRWT